MGNPNIEIRGLLKRTADYYNNRLFSDVTFRVRDADGEYKVFYAHKLILAMAGELFAKSCYNGTVGPSHTFKITDFTPHIVDLMLKYVYTDKIKFGSLEDVMNVLKLAKRFAIRDLIEECNCYLSQFQVDNNSVLAKYEIALFYKNEKLLGVCRRLVSSETKSVFESPFFCNASQNVIEDILKLEELSITGELEVIEAALRWSKAECVRKIRPSHEELCIRESFLPLCKHLRFLSLGIEEFFNFEDKNKIFLSSECIGLTEIILDKEDPKLTIPTNFCKLRTSRRFTGNSACNTFQHKANNNGSLNYPNQLNPATNSEKTIPDKVPLMVYPQPTNGTNNFISPNNTEIFNFTSQTNGPSSFKQTSPKMLSMPEKSTYYNYNSGISQTSLSKVNTEPPLHEFLLHKNKNAPMLRVLPQTKQKSIMSYEFPLHEMQKEIGSCFDNDVKCHIAIKMIRGAILIHEIELRVKDMKSTDEEIEVHLCFTNNSAPRSYSTTVQVRNSALQLPFSEPIVVTPKNPLDIEVMIEGLKLNRCSVCRNQENCCELNCGLNVTAEIALWSNQPNGADSFFFLISKILYSTPKYN